MSLINNIYISRRRSPKSETPFFEVAFCAMRAQIQFSQSVPRTNASLGRGNEKIVKKFRCSSRSTTNFERMQLFSRVFQGTISNPNTLIKTRGTHFLTFEKHRLLLFTTILQSTRRRILHRGSRKFAKNEHLEEVKESLIRG
jgi:hypothetical protein